MLVKEKLYQLIEQTSDEQLLNALLKMLRDINDSNNGKLFQSLSAAQKDELLLSNEESKIPSNLLNHEEAKKQHSRWL